MGRLLLGLGLGLWTLTVFGHARNYTTLLLQRQGETIRLAADIKLKDIEAYYGSAWTARPDLPPVEAEKRATVLKQYVQERFHVRAGEAECSLQPDTRPLEIDRDHPYGKFEFEVRCPTLSGELELRYDLFFDKVPDHLGVLALEQGKEESSLMVFSAKERSFRWKPQSRNLPFFAFLKEGIWHIWIGLDHILFLLVLLLAAPLRWEKGRWVPITSFREIAVGALKTVTAFTVSHSITLILASTGVLLLPSRLVESVIALSIAVASLNNFRPFLAHSSWPIAFVFGFIHGFGFASVLQELGTDRSAFASMLFGFNLGVEVGQLVIVAAALPLLYGLHRHPRWLMATVKWGSVAATGVALLWAIERGFALSFMPF